MNAHQRRVRQRSMNHFVGRQVGHKLPSGIQKVGKVRKIDPKRMKTPVGVDFEGAKRICWVAPSSLDLL